jgi:hypothetical protein
MCGECLAKDMQKYKAVQTTTTDKMKNSLPKIERNLRMAT